MLTQLHTTIPVHVIDKGSGIAFAVIDYGIEHNLIWVIALDEKGEIWCAPNPKIRVAKNWTLGRKKDQEVLNSPAAVDARRTSSSEQLNDH
nr:hypothetical protein [Qipengyuania seohaensis]